MISKSSNWIGPLYDGKRRGYIDWNGNWVLQTNFTQLGEFREGLAAFESQGRIGFIDESGRIVIDARFDLDKALPRFREGLASVTLDGKAAYIDFEGRTVFSAEDTNAWDFVDGKAILGRSDGYSIINREWREISTISVSHIPNFFDFPEDWDCFPCRDFDSDHDYRRAFINWRGEFIFPPIYTEVGPFFNGVAPFSPEEQLGPWGLVRLSGEVILEPTFHFIGAFSTEGLAPAAIEKKKFGYINTEGVWVIPPVYHNACPFWEGLACVTFPGKNRHGNKGFINPAGEVVIGPRFSRQAGFHDGWAEVEFEGMNQVIDRCGRVIWETPIS